jgi:hypothetical protein
MKAKEEKRYKNIKIPEYVYKELLKAKAWMEIQYERPISIGEALMILLALAPKTKVTAESSSNSRSRS